MPNQGKSSLIKANAIFSKPPPGWRIKPLDGSDRPTNGQSLYPGEILSWGERKQVRASVPLTCLAGSPCLSVPDIPETQNPKTVPGSTPIKAKTPLIVPNQGKSSLIKAHAIFFQTAAWLANQAAGWGGPAHEWSKPVPRRNPLLGERKQVRASVPLTRRAASPCLSVPDILETQNPKTVPGSVPIKANQGKRKKLIEHPANCPIRVHPW